MPEKEAEINKEFWYHLPELFFALRLLTQTFIMTNTNKTEADYIAEEADTPLYEVFKLQVQHIYDAEKQLIESFPVIMDAATNQDLREQLQDHFNQTGKHVTRLEEIFGIMGIKTQEKKCEAMKELVAEIRMVIKETELGSSTRDAALIMEAQKIEHYEIATYGGLVQFATSMGFETITSLLDQTLQEEKDSDILLSDIADKKVNWLAETEAK